jgi:hypothetical protein
MLVKVELTEKEKEGLSPKVKQNGTLAKYTEDAGDLKLFASADGSKTYLRVWETAPPKEGQSGPAKHTKTFYLVTPPLGNAATPAADLK